jgi:hypothetical protein
MSGAVNGSVMRDGAKKTINHFISRAVDGLRKVTTCSARRAGRVRRRGSEERRGELGESWYGLCYYY